VARDDDPRPPIEMVGQERPTTTTQRVETVVGARRRRNALVAVGAVVAIVLAGLALGGGDDDGEVSSPSTSSTATTTERETSTTERSTTTTTTIPTGPVFGEPIDAHLLAVAASRYVSIDLDTGARRPVADIPLGTVYESVPVRGGLVMVSNGEAQYHPVGDAPGDGAPIGLGEADRVLAAGRPDRVWVLRGGPSGTTPGDGGLRASLVDLEGELLRRVELEDDDVGNATPDALVLARGGRVYLVDDGGARPIADGSLVGTAGDGVIVVRCDDRADCSFYLHRPGAPVRALDGASVDADHGASVIGGLDGRFAIISYSDATSTARAALYDPDGDLVGDLEGSVGTGAFPVWLPGDGGLLQADPGGPPLWLHEGAAGWVEEPAPPALRDLRTDLILVIPG